MPKPRSEWIMGVIQLVFVIAIVGAAFLLSSALKPETNIIRSGAAYTDGTEGISVSVSRPSATAYAPTVEINGVVQSQTQINIAPQVGGRVIHVGNSFRPGAIVEKGEVLFQIDPLDFKLAVEQAEANIAAAQSDLAQLEAEAVLAREEWNELFPGQPITDLAAREPQMAAARARLASADAAKKTAELALQRTTITAPDTARILTTSLDVGQIISPNQSVGQLFSLESLEVSAPLSTAQLQLLMPVIGRSTTLVLSGNESDPRLGEVVRVDSSLDPRTRLATLYIKPDNLTGLTVGSFVDVFVRAAEIGDALPLPASAIAGRNDVWIVSDNKLSLRRVRVLGEENDIVYVSHFDTEQGVLTLPPVEAYEGQPATIRQTPETLAQGDLNASER